MAFSTSRSPIWDGPRKWNMSMLLRVGWALHKRLDPRQREGDWSVWGFVLGLTTTDNHLPKWYKATSCCNPAELTSPSLSKHVGGPTYSPTVRPRVSEKHAGEHGDLHGRGPVPSLFRGVICNCWNLNYVCWWLHFITNYHGPITNFRHQMIIIYILYTQHT